VRGPITAQEFGKGEHVQTKVLWLGTLDLSQSFILYTHTHTHTHQDAPFTTSLQWIAMGGVDTTSLEKPCKLRIKKRRLRESRIYAQPETVLVRQEVCSLALRLLHVINLKTSLLSLVGKSYIYRGHLNNREKKHF
jgi:hypothetical protein